MKKNTSTAKSFEKHQQLHHRLTDDRPPMVRGLNLIHVLSRFQGRDVKLRKLQGANGGILEPLRSEKINSLKVDLYIQLKKKLETGAVEQTPKKMRTNAPTQQKGSVG